MARGASGRRHAQAVFEIALENDALDEWQRDLESIAGALGNEDLVALLENPKVDLDRKIRIARDVLPDIAPAAANLVSLLVSRGRLRIVPDMLREFRRLVNAHYGKEEAEVTTAVAVSEEQVRQIAQDLSAILGKKVVVTSRVDPDILGGLVARVGDRLFDGSMRTRLRELKGSLA